VAVNLAYELARMGGRVGLLDVDVYGPSLPVLVKPDDPEIRQSSLGEGMVHPIEHKGVKLLSLGFVSPKVRNLIGNGMVAWNSLLGDTKTKCFVSLCC
jgi:ATP-binding protein involved in chromosome partitioning